MIQEKESQVSQAPARTRIRDQGLEEPLTSNVPLISWFLLQFLPDITISSEKRSKDNYQHKERLPNARYCIARISVCTCRSPFFVLIHRDIRQCMSTASVSEGVIFALDSRISRWIQQEHQVQKIQTMGYVTNPQVLNLYSNRDDFSGNLRGCTRFGRRERSEDSRCWQVTHRNALFILFPFHPKSVRSRTFNSGTQ